MRPAMRAVFNKFKRPLVGAEIGVRLGDHAHSILLRLPIKQLILVDIWDSTITGHTAKHRNQSIEINYPKVVNRFKNNPKVKIHRALSHEASIEYNDNQFDFIYIDASHAYKNVKVDLECWYPKLKQHGIICGHDYFDFLGVARAVDEFVEINNLKLDCDPPDWWAERNVGL